MSSKQQDFLHSEVATLNRLLEELPEGRVIERIGLQHRLREAEERLAKLEGQVKPSAITAVKPSIALEQHRDAIRRIVARHHASNARLFGSVLHGVDRPDSDLDILIDPTPETTLFDIGAIRHELLQLLGVPVDVLTPRALPERFRDAVLAEAKPV